MLSREDRISRFNDLVGQYVPEEFTDWLLAKGFFTSPHGSKRYGYEGGLFDHSIQMINILIDLTNKNNLQWARPESPLLIGMFHDLYKVDTRNRDGFNRENTNPLFKGLQGKSVLLLSSRMQMTDEENYSIRYHTGAFSDPKYWEEYTRAIRLYPNVLWTSHAHDLISYTTVSSKRRRSTHVLFEK